MPNRKHDETEEGSLSILGQAPELVRSWILTHASQSTVRRDRKKPSRERLRKFGVHLARILEDQFLRQVDMFSI
jgi:hypothetical protein